MEVCLSKLRQNIRLILERDREDCESKLLTGYLKTNLRIYENSIASRDAISNSTTSKENFDGQRVRSENAMERYSSLPPLKLNAKGSREVHASSSSAGEMIPDSKMSHRNTELSCINTDIIEKESKQLKPKEEFSSIDSNLKKLKMQINDKRNTASSRRNRLKHSSKSIGASMPPYSLTFSSRVNTLESLPSDRRCPARPNSATETVESLNESLCMLPCCCEESRFALTDHHFRSKSLDYKSGSDFIISKTDHVESFASLEKERKRLLLLKEKNMKSKLSFEHMKNDSSFHRSEFSSFPATDEAEDGDFQSVKEINSLPEKSNRNNSLSLKENDNECTSSLEQKKNDNISIRHSESEDLPMAAELTPKVSSLTTNLSFSEKNYNSDTNNYRSSGNNLIFRSQNSPPLSDTSIFSQLESSPRNEKEYKSARMNSANEKCGCSIFYLTNAHFEHSPNCIQTEVQIQEETKNSYHNHKGTKPSQHDLTEKKTPQYDNTKAAYLGVLDDMILAGDKDTALHGTPVNVEAILKFSPGTLSRSNVFLRIPEERISPRSHLLTTIGSIQSRRIKKEPIRIPVQPKKTVLLKMQHRQDRFVNRSREVHEEGRMLPILLSGLKKGGYSVMTPYMASIVWSIMEDEHVDKSRN